MRFHNVKIRKKSNEIKHLALRKTLYKSHGPPPVAHIFGWTYPQRPSVASTGDDGHEFLVGQPL